MTPKVDQLSKWKEIRAQGFLRFVFIRGFLFWGLGTATLYSLIMWLISDIDIGKLFPLAFILFPIGGLFWGAVMWMIIDRKYKQQAIASDT